MLYGRQEIKKDQRGQERIKNRSHQCLFYGRYQIKTVHKNNPNLHLCSKDESESKIIHKINICVNTRKVQDTRYEEPGVTDIEVIKVLGYFKLFNCGK